MVTSLAEHLNSQLILRYNKIVKCALSFTYFEPKIKSKPPNSMFQSKSKVLVKVASDF
jgi:hypothetical protein